MMKCGIIGLPNVGKSIIFQAITNISAPISNYPFCTIKPNIVQMPLPDEQLIKIASLARKKHTTPSTIIFIDLPGLIKGASKGKGLGNQFLEHIREVDILLYIVRCFNNTSIPYSEKNINPVSDVKIINNELILADLAVIEKRLQDIQNIKCLKKKNINKQIKISIPVLTKLKNNLSLGSPAQSLKLKQFEKEAILDLNLFTLKPVVYICNIDNSIVSNDRENIIKKAAFLDKIDVISMNCECSNEINHSQTSIINIFKTISQNLNLISFFTYNNNEIRSWTIKSGTKILDALTNIHIDFQKNFIKAEVISYKNFINAKNYNITNIQNLSKKKDKDYILTNGDIITSF